MVKLCGWPHQFINFNLWLIFCRSELNDVQSTIALQPEPESNSQPSTTTTTSTTTPITTTTTAAAKEEKMEVDEVVVTNPTNENSNGKNMNVNQENIENGKETVSDTNTTNSDDNTNSSSDNKDNNNKSKNSIEERIERSFLTFFDDNTFTRIFPRKKLKPPKKAQCPITK